MTARVLDPNGWHGSGSWPIGPRSPDGPGCADTPVVVSTNYAPELTGIGPFAAQLAEHWAASGAET
ncbi:hypothetical protein ACWD95_37035, partial [Streptomyces sp. NPDC005069]